MPTGGTLIDLAVSMKAMLELCIDSHGTPKNHTRNCRAEMGSIGYNIKLHISLLRWEVAMENKITREFSALASSLSFGERTPVESQSNGLYLASWDRHHDTAICSKSCISEIGSHNTD